MKGSTLQKEMNEAGARGYRLHPGVRGLPYFAVMETSSTESRYEYAIVSAHKGSKLQTEIAAFADQGYAVVAMAANMKLGGTSGVLLGYGYDKAMLEFVIAMERPSRKQ